ncbi:c-type cytochrome [Oceaniglobus roseus]|uniref:c-type cytochrome n=1 Tax=Oceaniglobus roseus TaxID=1737570 RepID=UPI000C7F581B|nr:c-type cytochrome [Kandeliimicrobium roseum]
MGYRIGGVAAAALLGLAAAGAAADERTLAAALYAQHCAVCHGAGGEGDGEMVAFLSIPVPDLTALSRGNGGAFPMGRVLDVIDGRAKRRGHVGPMPFFGPMLGRAAPDGPGSDAALIDAQGRILLIARHLRSIQRP